MNESFEAYKKRNVPTPQSFGQTASNPMEAVANANWLPWPRKDLAKGGKTPTKVRAHTRMVAKGGKKRKSY